MAASVVLPVAVAADVPIDEEQMLISYFQACCRSPVRQQTQRDRKADLRTTKIGGWWMPLFVPGANVAPRLSDSVHWIRAVRQSQSFHRIEYFHL